MNPDPAVVLLLLYRAAAGNCDCMILYTQLYLLLLLFLCPWLYLSIFPQGPDASEGDKGCRIAICTRTVLRCLMLPGKGVLVDLEP